MKTKHPIWCECLDCRKIKFDTDAYVIDGIPYWKSNNSIPPTEFLKAWDTLGLINFDVAEKARQIQVNKSLAEYRERQKNHVYSSEELSEMRNAFGEGVTVVNALTGRKIKL